MSFIDELRRRNVIRVAILYFVSSWLLLQLTDVLSSLLPVPEWTGSLVFLLLLVGLAPALIFAWVYEMTPEGLKREREVDRSRSITPATGRKINVLIVVLLVLAIAGMIVDRLVPERGAPALVAEGGESDEQTIDPASIAVLPFIDLSEDSDQQYFTDGLTEELLNLLVRVDGLRVASRTSSFAYRGTSLGIPRIAENLGVAHVLEGSVRKSGDRIRITAQLIEADTDRHLWSENFDRQLIDLFAIQDEIGNSIVNALKDELGILEEVTVRVEADTTNLDAYEHYLEARELFIKRENLLESIRGFRKAIELDPGFARAWEGLAAAQIVADDWVHDSDIDFLPLAREAAEKALSLDPGLSMSHAVLGLYAQLVDNDLVASETLYDRATRLDTNNTTAWLWYGLLLKESGYLDEADAHIRKCIEVDPGYLNCRQHLAAALLAQGREREALSIYEETLAANFHSTSSQFVPVYVRRGQKNIATLIAANIFGDSDAPVIEWIHALETPGADHSVGYARLKDWERNRSSGLRLTNIENLVLPFGQYDEHISAVTNARVALWSPEAAAFRRSPQFKTLVRDGGILAFWRARGFPEQCRSVGQDDFACEDPF